ncbi:MAG: hypothetical protein ACE5I3_11560, partial [Phycisphaerae bacterium]
MLIEPQADTLYRMTTTHHTHTLHSARLLDTSVDELRRQLRQRLELVEPVIVTGHQAEFCHAGVFAKTIAADALAAKSDGSRVFLTVDTDVPKATRLAVPYVERGEVRRAFVPIPGGDPQLAMEWQPRVPVAWWRDFFERVAKLAGGDDTLLRSYADGVFSGQRDTLDVNGAMQQGYAAVEQSLGLAGTANVRTSQLSATPEFRAFVAHLMQNAAGFAEHYNAAQRAYRSRRHERNPRRPAPLLALNGDRVELPFWVGRARQPRRRLSVAAGNEFVELFADDEPIGCEPLSRLRHAANLAGGFRIEAEGWHLRPRALTLSAFARLFLSDTFVHGI